MIVQKMKKIFREKFKHRTEFGNEYFEGNYKEMINIIFSTIKNEICKEEIEIEIEYDMHNTFVSELTIKEEIEYDMCNTFFSELTIKEALLEKSYNSDVYFTPCIICGENAVGKGHCDRYHTIQSFDINDKRETSSLVNLKTLKGSIQIQSDKFIDIYMFSFCDICGDKTFGYAIREYIIKFLMFKNSKNIFKIDNVCRGND